LCYYFANCFQLRERAHKVRTERRNGVEKERVGETHTRLTVETEGDFSDSEGRTARAGANASAEICARMRVFVCVHGCERVHQGRVLRARCAIRCENLPQTNTLHHAQPFCIQQGPLCKSLFSKSHARVVKAHQCHLHNAAVPRRALKQPLFSPLFVCAWISKNTQ